MTGSTTTLDPRRRKLLFRAWHRGIKEMDLILGGFAEAHLAKMDPGDLDEFELMLETSDRDLIKWFTNEEPVPDVADTPLFRRIAAHPLTLQG
jgi:antitoxin CptB